MRLSMLVAIVLTLATAASAQPAAGATPAAPVCGDPIDPMGEDRSSRTPCHVDVSMFTAAEHPSVFSDLKIRTTDLIEASLSVENKGGSLTYAPLLYTLSKYRAILSEWRLRVSQKDNLTTLGTGVQYNPLNPRSARGAALWLQQWGDGAPPPAFTLRTRLGQRVQAFEKQLESLRADYVSASTLPVDATPERLEQLRTQQSDIADRITSVQVQMAASKQEIAALEAAEAKRTDERVRLFYESLLNGHRPVIGGAYSVTMFSVLGGSAQDANTNGLNDVEHRIKQHALSLTADARLSERLQISALAGREWIRATAEEGVNFARTFGAGLTVGGLVAVLNKDYRQSAAYRESFFVPSVVLGGAIEYKRCTNSAETGVTCPDKVSRLTVFTAFVDLKVSKTVQVRIGAPLRRSRPVAGGNQTDVGVVTAFTLQLGEPK